MKCPHCGKEIENLLITINTKDMKPHKCPVCGGSGRVPMCASSWQSYTTYIPEKTCHACNGAGIVWG